MHWQWQNYLPLSNFIGCMNCPINITCTNTTSNIIVTELPTVTQQNPYLIFHHLCTNLTENLPLHQNRSWGLHSGCCAQYHRYKPALLLSTADSERCGLRKSVSLRITQPWYAGEEKNNCTKKNITLAQHLSERETCGMYSIADDTEIIVWKNVCPYIHTPVC